MCLYDPGHKEERLHIEPLPDDGNASSVPEPAETDAGLLGAETVHGGFGSVYAEICDLCAARSDGPAVAVVVTAVHPSTNMPRVSKTSSSMNIILRPGKCLRFTSTSLVTGWPTSGSKNQAACHGQEAHWLAWWLVPVRWWPFVVARRWPAGGLAAACWLGWPLAFGQRPGFMGWLLRLCFPLGTLLS